MCYTFYLALSVKFVTGFPPKACLLTRKIILKIQLVENKEVTLLVELNW